MDNPRAEPTDLSDIGHNGGAGSFKNRTIDRAVGANVPHSWKEGANSQQQQQQQQ